MTLKKTKLHFNEVLFKMERYKEVKVLLKYNAKLHEVTVTITMPM